MDLRQLEYVVAVADEQNFTRAAARCHIVQSGLSHQIARLEREFGQPLFERTSRKVRLAPAGAALLPYARRILDEVERGRAQVAALRGVVQGTLHIGVIPASSAKVDLPETLKAFHQQYPGVDVIVSDTGSLGMVAMILSGQMDAGFVGLFAEQLPPGLTHRLLSVEPLVVVVDDNHPCARRTSVGLREIAGMSSFIDCHHDSGVRTQVDAAFARASVQRHISFELGNLADVARMATLGLGAAIVPSTVGTAIKASSVHARILKINDPQALQPIGAIFRDPEPASPAARAFIDLIRAAPATELMNRPSGPVTAQLPTRGRAQ